MEFTLEHTNDARVVQYSQMTPLVLVLVRMVPLENDIIPMVALVNVHLIKGT